MYEVVKTFKDKESHLHTYHKGEEYPIEGYSPQPDRIEFLMASGFIKEKKKSRKKKEDK